MYVYMADNDPHGMRLIVCKFYSHSIHSYVHAGRQSSVIQMITKEPFHLLVCRTAAASTAGWLLLLLLLLLSIYNIFIFLPTDLTLATPPRPLWDFNLLVNIISHRLLNWICKFNSIRCQPANLPIKMRPSYTHRCALAVQWVYVP